MREDVGWEERNEMTRGTHTQRGKRRGVAGCFFFYTKITNFDGGSKNIKYVFNANLIIDEFIVYPKSYICNDIYPINSFFSKVRLDLRHKEKILENYHHYRIQQLF
jgi:hypothetical protein